MGFTPEEAARVLDNEFPETGSGDWIAYSTNGTSEFAGLSRTAVGDWDPATVASPAVKANADALTSATASTGGTVTHFAVFSAATGGRQRTAWETVDEDKELGVGDTASWQPGALKVTMQ